MNALVAQDDIERMIFLVRDKKVMLDRDLAGLYNVTTSNLNKAVARNRKRFPDDFMFRLSAEEALSCSRFQSGTLKRGQNLKYLPYAFTENGVAMLSSVLRSDRAVQINIQIMRAFTRLRSLIAEHKDIRLVLEKLERRVDRHDMQIQVAFNSLKQLLDHPFEPVPPRRGAVSFGFVPKKNPGKS